MDNIATLQKAYADPFIIRAIKERAQQREMRKKLLPEVGVTVAPPRWAQGCFTDEELAKFGL